MRIVCAMFGHSWDYFNPAFRLCSYCGAENNLGIEHGEQE
jgi:hypothetical protein